MTTILDRLRAGEADLETRQRILKLRLIPDDDLLQAIPIMVSQNAELKIDAQNVLNEMPTAPQIGYFENPHTSPEDLAFYLKGFHFDQTVLSILILNPLCPAEALFSVASRISTGVLDQLVNNQVKILEKPEIVDELFKNPGISVNQKQKLEDYKRLLFRDLVSPAEELEKRSLAEIEEEAIRDAKDWVQTFGMEKVSQKELVPEKEEEISVIKQIAKMSIPQKIQAAIKGNREVRGVLVRDANKLVCSAVIRSPRITEAEAEFYSSLRNVQTDVLRLISMNREWTKNYKIILILVKNPRTPIGISMTLLKRIMPKDLRLLKIDRGIPEALRTYARRELVTKKK